MRKLRLVSVLLLLAGILGVPCAGASSFFKKKPVPTLVEGKLEGYTPERYGRTGLIYLENVATDEDIPRVVAIEEDGRFHVTLPLQYPLQSHIIFGGRKYIPFYVEPGHKLSVTVNAEKVSGWETAGLVTYTGPDAEVARQLNDYPIPVIGRFADVSYGTKNLKPLEFRDWLLSKMHKELARIDSLERAVPLVPLAADLMRMDIRISVGTGLFDYIRNNPKSRNYLWHEAHIPVAYYDFLKEMPLDDPRVFSLSGFTHFVNIFENSVFRYPVAGSRHYAFDIPEAVRAIREGGDTIEGEKALLLAALEKMPDVMNAFSYAYTTDNWIRQLFPKGTANLRHRCDDIVKEGTKEAVDWDIRMINQLDSILKVRYGVDNTLFTQLCRAHSFRQMNEFKEPEVRSYALKRIFELVPTPILRAAIVERADAQLAREKNQARPLPKDAVGTQIMREILRPHQGKYVMVDFWGLFCGPCRGGIESSTPLRKELVNNPDFTFVYITSDDDSPSEKDYNEYVEKHMLGYASHRLPQDRYNYLRELFRFNGIPHYVIFDRKGNMLDGDYHFYTEGLQRDLEKWIGK